ncbi:lipase family protein [Chitinophaga sp. MM2321]|uniref:lipase family protein n=1 Tax=Chitinophaga sp. MM2321 TaxID=3137178 RepID=UPI0032D57B4E
MMFRISLLSFLFLFFLGDKIFAQHLTPYFHAAEYGELLKMIDRLGDTPWTKVTSTAPRDCELTYRSAEAGLANRWDLWLNKKERIGFIVIRGTDNTTTSWMENFYAGMISAQGTLKLDDSTNFPYKVAADSKAYVHAGWMLGLAAMAPEMVNKIKDCYRQGIHEFVIAGHSQGGAIAFLARSYFQYLDDLPKDIVFKTYCSAAPKPGNLFYAYDFDFITRDGWGLRVVNARDWVPEVPFSLQTTKDFNTANPFTNIKGAIKKQKFPVHIALGYAYGRLDRPSKRASRRMQRVLGKMVYTRVKKVLPEYEMPVFVNSHNYTPAGSPVILYPVAGYDEKFKTDGNHIFIHHMPAPYRWLLQQIYQVDPN